MRSLKNKDNDNIKIECMNDSHFMCSSVKLSRIFSINNPFDFCPFLAMDKKILISIALFCNILDLVNGALELKQINGKQAIEENDGITKNEMP